MWEIKTEAPAEIRGEFKPIATNVPGIQIGEVLPAARRDDGQVRRHPLGRRRRDRHDAFQCMTGWPHNVAAAAGRPAEHRLGAVEAARARSIPSVPPFVGLAAATQHVPWSDPGQPGFLGPAYAPFKPDGPGMANMKLNGIIARRSSATASSCSTSFDTLPPRHRRQPAASQGMDAFTEQAFDVLTSSKLLDALDLSQGDPTRSASATATASRTSSSTTARRPCNDQLLMARRLVEAGVRCVTLTLRPLGQPRQELRPRPRPRRQARPVRSPP